MKRIGASATAIVLGMLVIGPAADASFTRVPVPKGGAVEKELGYTITVTPNGPNSGLAGTVSVELRAPRTPRLRDLSRAVLRVYRGKELAGRLPLELQKGKAGEVVCHFQLAPAAAGGAVLELVCPSPGMPNGEIFEIDLSAHVAATAR